VEDNTVFASSSEVSKLERNPEYVFSRAISISFISFINHLPSINSNLLVSFKVVFNYFAKLDAVSVSKPSAAFFNTLVRDSSPLPIFSDKEANSVLKLLDSAFKLFKPIDSGLIPISFKAVTISNKPLILKRSEDSFVRIAFASCIYFSVKLVFVSIESKISIYALIHS